MQARRFERPEVNKPYHRYRRLLRSRREGQRDCRAAENRDEIPSPHANFLPGLRSLFSN
jgi:hypothetical protein